MKYFKYLLFSLAILSSCSKPEENFIKIPSEFSVSLQEEIKPNGSREVWLELSSMNSGYCQDDSLVYNITPGYNSLAIEISDSYKANDCFQRIFFLKSRIRLPDFSDSLQIHFELSSSSSIDCTAYNSIDSINNSKNYFNIEINKGTGIIKKFPKTYKIPYNLIWGYAYPKSIGLEGEEKMNKFKSEIEYDCTTKWLPKGYYTYFSVLNSNILQLNENPGIAGNYLNFYFSHNKTEEELSQFFNKLASEYVGLVGYKINSGSGKEFRSN